MTILSAWDLQSGEEDNAASPDHPKKQLSSDREDNGKIPSTHLQPSPAKAMGTGGSSVLTIP